LVAVAVLLGRKTVLQGGLVVVHQHLQQYLQLVALEQVVREMRAEILHHRQRLTHHLAEAVLAVWVVTEQGLHQGRVGKVYQILFLELR
jgi:hypothetical protein